MLSYLRSLKANQLRALAIETGTYSSGNKAVLSSRIIEALHQRKPGHGGISASSPNASSETRQSRVILSIDMGIRNLAYCCVALEEPHVLNLGIRTHKSVEESVFKASMPSLLRWDRVTISSAPLDTNQKESFDLATYAAHAYNLIYRLVLSTKLPPSIVLIERQRFRTMGGASVQEWTLRINTFEAMLWTVLEAAKRNGSWSGQVYAIDPAMVARWCSAKDRGGTESNEASTNAAIPSTGKAGSAKALKQEKICLVARWLRGKELVLVNKAAQQNVDDFLLSHKGTSTPKGANKLDDLADSLVQCVAWISWEKYRYFWSDRYHNRLATDQH